MYSPLKNYKPGHLTEPLDRSEQTWLKPEIRVVKGYPQQGYSAPPSWIFFLYLSGFVILESLFLLLAAVCLPRPLILNKMLSDYSLPEVKGASTILLISWQTLSIVLVKSIVMDIFSSEWHEQAARSGVLIPYETDKVSTLTAGYREKIAYFFSEGSGAFRIAFIISLFLLAIGGLAPGSLGVSTVLIDKKTTIQVANLTMGYEQTIDFFGPFSLIVERAGKITTTEQIENTTFKYAMPSNWIIPTPGSDFMTDNDLTGSLTYFSDLVHFNYSCSWKIPLSGVDNGTISDGNVDWAIFPTVGSTDVPTSYNAGIFPLVSTGPANISLSAYIFLGSNSTVPDARNPDGSPLSGINLDGLPTNSTTTNFFSRDLGLNETNPALLVTMLVCDPHMHIIGGQASLAVNGSLTILSESSELPLLGNIPSDAANLMFSSALLDGLSAQDLFGDTNSFVNGLSSLLFLGRNYELDVSNSSVHPFSLDIINRNMNAFVLSGTKAFSDGYAVEDDSVPFGIFMNARTDAAIQEQQLGLVTSKPLFIITCGCVPLVIILTLAMYTEWRRRKGYTFSLESLLEAKLIKED
ncbi:hypothetical protein M422DRAFT_253104 [Sphaerobolus stellatus SS14]|uniref:Uncharacterized protein n=1 Tax=Sphaerobolus stellatus (strain SS14) TaxID=990650 RepID=A0A0C9UKD6_SPHS4|nr:hypothetical protein M422DRAFT_253104 [Sphaerobolus stellatus SS14]